MAAQRRASPPDPHRTLRSRLTPRCVAATPVYEGSRAGVTITQPTATFDAVTAPPTLAQRGPVCVATTRSAYIPRKLSQARARRLLADANNVVEMREQGRTVEVTLVARAVRSGLQRGVGRLAQRRHMQPHPASRPTIVGGCSGDGDSGGQAIRHKGVVGSPVSTSPRKNPASRGSRASSPTVPVSPTPIHVPLRTDHLTAPTPVHEHHRAQVVCGRALPQRSACFRGLHHLRYGKTRLPNPPPAVSAPP
jgi:hypothetical protein